ncbi:MAG: hypothetical protein P8R54_18940 [Myxococcota bacterium]|nr:hypothetical protein [Myxococcota bacterium]
MKGVLSRLQSIRELKKKQAWLELIESERLREEQYTHLTALEAEVAAVRTVADIEEAGWAAYRHSWCLQMEMRRRRAEESLAERTKKREDDRVLLESARREARTIGLVLERIERDEAIEARREEGRRNDEIGTMSWWRVSG